MTRGTGKFTGKVALVTGGAGDIGLTTARQLGANGAKLALLDVDEAALEAAVLELTKAGFEVVGQVCDVTDEDAVNRTVQGVVDTLGPLHLLFNNAGYQGAFAPTHRYPADDFRKVHEINVLGAFYVLAAVTRHMVEAGTRGAVVNTASHAGVKGPPNMLAYGSSKFAVIGMTQTAAKDLAPHGIRVNAISPGLIGPGKMWFRQCELQAAAGSQYFSTDSREVERQMIESVPLRRLGTLEDVADAVTYLLSDQAAFVTGFNLELTGGQ